ncbi:MAG: hypothetical protein H6686_10440 [Fibrobacteria bacterium]|nr:hypothetical protein [Fibrobacteria bacterium]
MRAFSQAFLCLSIATSAWAAETRTGAAAMDPYLPIRNSALQFELGASYYNQPGYFAGDTVGGKKNGFATGSGEVKFPEAGNTTEIGLKIRHGFVAGTEAILEIPYTMASGGARRVEPVKEGVSAVGAAGDTASGGFGDWTFAVKSVYEPWGLGGYFAVILPVGEIFGSNAYTNGDGQINAGLMYGHNWSEQYFGVLANFVYGYDLPATNRKIDKQDSYTLYVRLSGLFSEDRYRPYVAYTLEGYGDHVINKDYEAEPGMRHIVTPGIDMTPIGDFSFELGVPVVLAGTGNRNIALTSGWGVEFAAKYFWYRF